MVEHAIDPQLSSHHRDGAESGTRAIMHVDLDAFFSSIEQRDDPVLRGKPVIVGGDPDARGVVATASYEARGYGVHSAMPSRTAMRLCPEAVLIHPRFDAYAGVSGELRALFLAITPLVEPIAFDEAYLDLSAFLSGPSHAAEAAHSLKRRIREDTGLTASIGVATNKLVAKVASDSHKPDGLTIIEAGGERTFLAPMAVRALTGIGPRTEQRLLKSGIEKVHQLADAEQDWLLARFGMPGLEWRLLAQGQDSRPVIPDRELKQISRERTFSRDLAKREELLRVLEALVEELSPALQSALPARTFTLKLRYTDFAIVTRRLTPGAAVTAEVLGREAPRLFEDSWDGRPLRLMGLGISNFILPPAGQPSLFDSLAP